MPFEEKIETFSGTPLYAFLKEISRERFYLAFWLSGKENSHLYSFKSYLCHLKPQSSSLEISKKIHTQIINKTIDHSDIFFPKLLNLIEKNNGFNEGWAETLKDDTIAILSGCPESFFSELKIQSQYIGQTQSKEIDEDEQKAYREGKREFKIHQKLERNSSVIKKAKELGLERDPLLKCTLCGFSFQETYGEIMKGFIEAHHITPLGTINDETETKVGDIMLVCSNCHRYLHREKDVEDSIDIS